MDCVYSDGITKPVNRYTKRNGKWCYRVGKKVFKECVLIFVKTLGSYTKQHNTFALNSRRNKLPSSSRRLVYLTYSGVPRIFFRGGGGGLNNEFFRWVLHNVFFLGWGGSTNVVAEKGQREWGSWGGSPLVRGSTQFANEWNPYSD
jgi:hypothetical protein